jgi:hypothetical protein
MKLKEIKEYIAIIVRKEKGWENEITKQIGQYVNIKSLGYKEEKGGEYSSFLHTQKKRGNSTN